MILPRISPLPRVNPRGELGNGPVATSSPSNATLHGRLPRCVPCRNERVCAVHAGHAPPARVPRRFGPRPCRLRRRAAPSRPAAAPPWPEGLAVSTGGPSASNGRPCSFARRPCRLDRRPLPPGTARAAAWGVRCRRRFRRRGAAKGRLGHPKTPLPPLPTPRPRQLAQAAYGADAIFMPDVQGATYTNRLRTYYACVLRFAPPPTVAHRPAARSGAPARRMAAVAAVASASAPASTTADPIRRASHQGSTGPAHLPQQVSHPRVRACHDPDDNAPGQTSGGAVGLHCPIRSDRQRSKGRPCACASVRSSTASCEYVQRMRVCYCICCVAHACGCAFLHERASERREFRCCALSM